MKDYFSSQSKAYAAFRPTYPKALYDFIFRQVRIKETAWDCATGNGQVASYLADYFHDVYATDISQQQLDHAHKKRNIHYSIGSAERPSFESNQFDLITVAQALHWFDRDKFYEEVKRVGKPDSILAIWGYAMLYIEPSIDELILNFYNETVGPYWDDARRLVEQEYQTISFPFEKLETPRFSIEVEWTLSQLSGYFSSWSATQKYIKEKGTDPVPDFIETLRKHWTRQSMNVTFPIFTRIGTIKK
jgi:ubiquinone/menaquinone biosynthesis C-methylase UbiE